MASKKLWILKKVSTDQKLGGAGASISCSAFEKDGHFRRHSETTVILSYTKNHHMGEIKGEPHHLRGKTRGIYTPILRCHSERMVIVIPMRSSYVGLAETLFQPTV